MSLCDIFPVSSGTFTRFIGRACPIGESKFLRSENMTEEETGNEAFCFYRTASYGGEDGYVKVVIEPAEDGMTVTFSLTDEIGE